MRLVILISKAAFISSAICIGRKAFLLLLSVIVLGSIATEALRAKSIGVKNRKAEFVRVRVKTVKFDHSHRLASAVLTKHVKVSGAASTVNYRGLKANSSDLDKYLTSLQSVAKSDFMKWNKKQQLAFLINAYNLYSLKLIIEHYPLKSIRNIGSVFTNTWNKKFDWLKLFGVQVTLDNIEHDMIREKRGDLSNKLVEVKYEEPRIHFAVNCASIGCPMLPNQAFTAQNLEKKLEKATKLFMSDTSRNRFNAKEKRLEISPIVAKWYKDDFVKYSGGVKKFCAKYMTDDPKVKQAILHEDTVIDDTAYNWNLNE